MRTYVVNIVFDLFHNPFERYCCNVTSYRQRFMLKIPFWLCSYRHMSCYIQQTNTETYTGTVVYALCWHLVITDETTSRLELL